MRVHAFGGNATGSIERIGLYRWLLARYSGWSRAAFALAAANNVLVRGKSNTTSGSANIIASTKMAGMDVSGVCSTNSPIAQYAKPYPTG
jgi:hypothetical protein